MRNGLLLGQTALHQHSSCFEKLKETVIGGRSKTCKALFFFHWLKQENSYCLLISKFGQWSDILFTHG